MQKLEATNENQKEAASRTRAEKKDLTDENCQGRRSAEPVNRVNNAVKCTSCNPR